MSTQQDEPPRASLVGTDDEVREAVDVVSRARRALRSSTPGTSMAAVLERDGDAGHQEQARRLVVGGVEELTGLRLGELQALTAVSAGADHYRAVARHTGQADAAAQATVEGLVRKGVLAQHHHPAEPNVDAAPTMVHLTPKGEAVLGQAEAIRIRLLDTVAQSLSETEVEQVRAAAEALRPGPLIDERRQIGGRSAAS